MSVKVVTMGCRLNTFESAVIKSEAESAGLKDTVFINTCAVTSEAVRQAGQMIRKARRENPSARIVVTGCAAQIEPRVFGNMKEVDLVLGNSEKLNSETYQQLDAFDTERVQVNDIMSVRQTANHMVDGFEGRVRAFVQVQNGCDHRCTFCVIPYGRGQSRSVPIGVVINQIRRLVENGYREVVLTGVDITSYGLDLPGNPKFGYLVKKILKLVPELDQLRISSIDSVEVDHDLLDAIASESRLMPHLHLSLQHGDDLILKRMKRRHLRKDSVEFCQKVSELRPGVVFGADIIAGFPTETEDMFKNSLSIVDECDLTHLHVFPYSPRPNTPAARMPQVDRNTVKFRAQRLRKKGEAALQNFLEGEIGKRRKILVEKQGMGRTQHFTRTVLDSGSPGQFLDVDIIGHESGKLHATIC